MTVKITIIGLGRIGASMGLALAGHKDQVAITGHDKSPDVARKAQSIGAVDKISYNLPASVDGADVIILAMPFDQVYATLKIIARDLREEAVILDVSPVKFTVEGWMEELLPPRRHYIGLTPSLNPAYLANNDFGIGAAHADLFQKSLVAIVAPRGTADGALALAANFVNLIGGQPYYVDTMELDGIMASAHLLPELTAVALAETVIGQPGWPDIRKLAGDSFVKATSLLDFEQPVALAQAASKDRENTVRVLNEMIARLIDIRDQVQEGDEKSLAEHFNHAWKEREAWWQDRFKGDWQSAGGNRPEMPRMGDILKQQIGGLDKIFGRRGKKPDED
jgi:prephenate dehydrogenase